VHGSFVLIGKRVVDFLLVLVELFSPVLTVGALWADINRNIVVFERGWISLSANFRKNGVAHQRLLVRKLESLGYHVALFAWSYV